MHLEQYRPDRRNREAMQRPVREAREAMERAHQAVLLVDTDENRRGLRWELIRPRGLEPFPDTAETQRLYAEVLRYEHLRLQVGVVRLQDDLLAALGHATRDRSDGDRTFTEDALADAKAKAKAADEQIKAKSDSLFR
jgi:hypothetical protein